MTDTHAVFRTSIANHSSCLETKMASLDTGNNIGEKVTGATRGLIDGEFDVDSLLAELTIEEKGSLLSGIVATCFLDEECNS